MAVVARPIRVRRRPLPTSFITSTIPAHIEKRGSVRPAAGDGPVARLTVPENRQGRDDKIGLTGGFRSLAASTLLCAEWMQRIRMEHLIDFFDRPHPRLLAGARL